MALEFKRCVKLCDPKNAVECAPCYSNNQCGQTAGVCAPSFVRVNTCGEVKKVFCIKDNKAYFKLKKICYENTPGKPVLIAKNLDLTFNLLDVYKITFTVYPCGCPMAQLPIELETVESGQGLNITVTSGLNSITIEGEIPVGTVFRFFTNPRLLRYFEGIELVGDIELTGSACQMRIISERDASTNIRYIPSRPAQLSLLPPIPFPAPGQNPLLPDQYPPGAVFPWTEAIIPWEQNQPFPAGPPPGLIITPPAPVPPIPPFVDGYNDAYNKFRSVPDSVIFYLGYDASNVSPTQSDWTLFLRNFADRGYAKTDPAQAEWEYANFAKRQYMDALTVDKMQFYLEKIETFVNTAYTEVVANRKPLTSSFQRNVVLFFLSIHIGIYEYPEFVLKYFGQFIDFVGIGDPNDPRRNELLLYGNMVAPQVFEYFKAQATIAIQNEDKSTIAYWWNLSGLSQEALLFESVHNIVAFSQFTNVLYSVIYSKLVPTNPINPALPAYPDFLQLYASAPNGDERLNVVREAYRLLVPNSNSFSRVNNFSDNIQARHLHQSIMVSNYPGNQTQQLFQYFTYNTAQYAGFATNLDGLVGLPVSTDFLTQLPTSPLDRETVVDIARPVIPIFPKPTYAPFGLGYRRCAGEILVYLVTEKLFERFGQAEYEFAAGTFPTVYIAPFKGVPDNIFAQQPI
jgi:hypothetical protein